MFEHIAARHARDLVEDQFGAPRHPRGRPAPRTRRRPAPAGRKQP
jgi:hypothetical protein